MPDVIIWMLKAGTQRIAYCRIPANDLLYTPEEEQRGIWCGKIIDINLKVSANSQISLFLVTDPSTHVFSRCCFFLN